LEHQILNHHLLDAHLERWFGHFRISVPRPRAAIEPHLGLQCERCKRGASALQALAAFRGGARTSRERLGVRKHGLVLVANQYPWCPAAWFERTASPAQIKTICRLNTDQLQIPDDFDPASEW
jgi:hypothetical protein